MHGNDNVNDDANAAVIRTKNNISPALGVGKIIIISS